MNESETGVTDEDRLRDLAHLSGAVGHFLINAFSAVVSNAEQIRSPARGPSDPSQIEALSSSIVKTAVDASHIARRLIDCTRQLSMIDDDRGSSEPRSVDLNPLIQETIESSTTAASPGIARVVRLGSIPPIDGYASRLRSMFRHLIRNAVEAMEGGSGTLTVSTYTDPKGWAIIEIGDTGPGISPEILRQATEPFFSTKPDHAGIGLTIAQAICRRHRGSLSIDSQPGRGTTIRLTFVLPAPPRSTSPPPTSTRDEKPSQASALRDPATPG